MSELDDDDTLKTKRDGSLKTKKEICVAIGNPPWEKNKDIKTFMKIVNAPNFITGGVVDMCMNAGWIRGPNGKKFRDFITSKGSLEQITIFTANSFKNPSTGKIIENVGCRVLFIKGKQQREDVKIIRFLGNGHETSTTTTFTKEAGSVLYFGEVGKRLHSKIIGGESRYTINEYGNFEYYNPNGTPNLTFGKCSNVNRIGTYKSPFGDMTGNHVISPPVLDKTGTIKYVGSEGSERRIIEVPKGKEYLIDNLGWHFKMRAFGLAFLQISVVFRTLSEELEPLLSTVLTDKYDSFEDYEKAWYASIELNKDDIENINALGVNYSYHIDKDAQDSVAITSIERSVERVKETGEVFTPDEIVKIAIRDNIYYLHDKSKLIIEPTCGEGAYLLAMIIDRKEFGLSDIENITNLRGFDIKQDNVDFVKKKILEILEDNVQIRNMVDSNIQRGDFMYWDLKEDMWLPGRPDELIGDIDIGVKPSEELKTKIKKGKPETLQLFDI